MMEHPSNDSSSDKHHNADGPLFPPPDPSSAASFEDGVANVLMRLEELRLSLPAVDNNTANDTKKNKNGESQSLSSNDELLLLEQWQWELEELSLTELKKLQRFVLDRPEDVVRGDLYRHVRAKTVEIFRVVLQRLQRYDIAVHEQQQQQIVARLYELALLLLLMSTAETTTTTSTSTLNGTSNRNSSIKDDNDDNNSQQQQRQQDEEVARALVAQYASYQRWVLRHRAKPAIAQLAEWRRNHHQQQQQQSRSSLSSSTAATYHHEEEEDQDATAFTDTTTTDAMTFQQQPHAYAMTVILGQASALLHPLQLWQRGLPPPTTNSSGISTTDEQQRLQQQQQQQQQHYDMVTAIGDLCRGAIQVLDEQSQSLTKTVSEWFWEDRRIDEWMTRLSSNHHSDDDENNEDLAELDGTVEEMAFGCQLLARYQALLRTNTASNTSNSSNPLDQLLPEWTWTYASLERYLATRQWQSALQLACPVHIVIGTSLTVPSVVEDAQYLSTRALERAISTRSWQAMGTVAHSLSHDIWSVDLCVGGGGGGGVHEALLQERGCYKDASEEEDDGTKLSSSSSQVRNGSSNTFAAALLDALDEDLGTTKAAATSPKNTSKPPATTGSAPQSGGFLLGSLALGGGQQQVEQQQQMRLDTQLCALNGMQSASVACKSLASSLDALLEDDSLAARPGNAEDNKATAMIQLAREELLRYAEAYRQLMHHQVSQLISEWCGDETSSQKGQCLQELRSFLQREDYNLNATSFAVAEADARLERDMMACLEESRLLRNLDKCDADVTVAICREMSSRLAALLLECLWRDDDNVRVTDWGALLLSKQVRLIQNYVAKLLEEKEVTIPFLEEWERVSQVVTVLQLEKPSDWLAYQTGNVVLSNGELRKTLCLRVDFSAEAISAVCGASSKAEVDGTNMDD